MARILLADDDAGIRKSFTALLSTAGHTVITASDGSKAIECLKWEDFDLLLTDIVMPDKEGLETIQEVRKSHPHLKIIAMSGGGMLRPADYLSVAQVLGAHRTLTKPCRANDLLQCVDEVLQAP